MAKVGRPREPLSKISKWAIWKRGQRSAPKGGRKCSVKGCNKPADLHHRNNEQRDNRPSNLVALCRSHHTSAGNKARHNR
jgi:hypothetical protein